MWRCRRCGYAHRGAPDARAFDWGLVDSLIPCGGIRIEDDVHVTALGCDNLTRQFLPGHLGDRLEAQDPAG